MTRIMNSDLCILRDLAKQYKELTARPEQDERRTLWRRHNSLKGDRPLIYIRAYAWKELPVSNCKCQDSLLRKYENILRYNLFWSTFNDDSIFEPWITVNAAYLSEGWGVQGERHFADESAGSWKTDYPIKNLEDIDLLREPVHQIDEQRTREEYERIQDALGNILTVNLDRGPAYRMWTGDLSTDLGYLRGIEHFMLDMKLP